MLSNDPSWTKIAAHTWHYTPKTSGSNEDDSTTNTAPDLLILLPWMYAKPQHILKYITPYQTMFQNMPILLIVQDGSDLSWRTVSSQHKRLKPAVNYLDTLIARHQSEIGREAAPRVLVHIFSNGGAYQAVQLSNTFSKFSTRGLKALPISGLLIDSAPSIPTFWQGVEVLSMRLPENFLFRILGRGVILLFLVLMRILRTVTRGENRISMAGRILNESNGAFVRRIDGGGSMSRCYIYSDEDRLVPKEHVRRHIGEARRVIDGPQTSYEEAEQDVEAGQSRRKSTKVWEENFGNSPHVAHMMKNRSRYWQMVHDFWRFCMSEKMS